MTGEPEISEEDLATFCRCTFARRIFMPYPTLRAKQPMDPDDLPPDSREGDWHLSRPYTGGSFDPEKWELEEDGWDHEHCDVCWGRITAGMAYWPNVDPDAGHVDLCEACYARVMPLLGAAPGA